MYPDNPNFNSPQDFGRLEISKDEIDAVLKDHRRARQPAACYACHRRKVKCDRGLPCGNCVLRDYPELCSYERPNQDGRVALGTPPAHPDHSAQSDKADYSQHHSEHNIIVPSAQLGKTNKELQILCETAESPLPDLFRDISILCKALPDDSSCQEFFVAYRDIACSIYPVIVDIATFEAKLVLLLSNRHLTRNNGSLIDPDKPFGVSISWLALLFAILALGAQSTEKPAEERENVSQIYVFYSHIALGMANFWALPSFEAIQALQIIRYVLSYNMNSV